jgi:23S rRNA-/tRNA-specific pseudouridylate synthase
VSGGGGGAGTSNGAAREPWLDSRRASAWPRRETTGRVRLITADEVKSWIIFEDEQLLVVNKPGDVVCHPSKAGPWSSLVGATREYTRLPVMHLVFRLDRETSGVVVLAKNAAMASRLQTAMMERKAGKEYLAVMVGFAQKYQKDAGIGTIVALMLPYTVILLIIWTLMLVIWNAFGIPLGPA